MAVLKFVLEVNPLNAELNPIFHLLALLGAHHIFHVSGLRVNVSYGEFWGGWSLTKQAGIVFGRYSTEIS